jgi:DNA-binding NarL/FixJ family response regulator
VVLSDPHPIVLAGMRHLFQSERDVRVLACCTNDQQTLETVLDRRPAILMLDLHLPRRGGLAVLRDLATHGADTRVVLLANSVSNREVVEALRLGVRGVVLKDMDPQLFVHCVRRVSQGERWIENQSFAAMMDSVARYELRMHELRRRLTRREFEIVNLVSDGLLNPDIRARLDITEGTLKIHLHNIYGKLGVKDRMRLARYSRGEELA